MSGKEDIKLALATVALVLLAVNIPKIVFHSNYTPWNVFYERQAEEAYYEGRIPESDRLSYEGRYMSFPQGYFTAK
ncbi:MAG: hypothetical protein QMD85_04005, partial [Candidatus Aenigmarchaeota archaeon]|nr:hypothetical protein [Candidatus Aenigmarchaeota archaeon]MDI6722724.1 hypothetical protein [Candidatus Aenigmarchaeota archaeon]